MSEPIKPRLSLGKSVLGTVLALLTGGLFPILAIYQTLLPMALPSLTTMVSVALASGFGWGFAVLLWVAALVSSVFGMGTALSAAVMLMNCIPAAVAILGVRQRLPFFEQLRRALAASLGGVALAVVITVASFGGDVIQKLVGQMQAAFDGMLPQLWAAYEDILPAAGISMSYEDFSAQITSMLRIIQLYYEVYLPANLLAGAVWTAALSTLWGNWLAARRGMATSESFAGLFAWRLPANLTWGILLTLAAAFALKFTSIAGADAAWAAVLQLSMTAFTLQVLGANDRRLKNGGASVGRRTVSVVLLMLVGGIAVPLVLGLSVTTLLGVIGAASAVFGRYGALRPWMDKHKKDINGSGR